MQPLELEFGLGHHLDLVHMGEREEDRSQCPPVEGKKQMLSTAPLNNFLSNSV